MENNAHTRIASSKVCYCDSISPPHTSFLNDYAQDNQIVLLPYHDLVAARKCMPFLVVLLGGN